jgi:hypothetical protein
MAINIKKPNLIKNNVSNKPETAKEFVKSVPKHGSLLHKREVINSKSEYPWELPLVRDDVLKLFNVRLPESDWLKLKFIAEKKGKSMQQICLDSLIPAIHKELKKLIK